MRVISRMLNAYPYRLKRLLFLNAPTALPLISQLTDIVKKHDPETQVETMLNNEDLTRYIAAEER